MYKECSCWSSSSENCAVVRQETVGGEILEIGDGGRRFFPAFKYQHLGYWSPVYLAKQKVGQIYSSVLDESRVGNGSLNKKKIQIKSFTRIC